MDINELLSMADEYIAFSCKPKLTKHPKGTIFDEEKSVRWNKEEVERLNKEYEDEVRKLNRQKNLLYTNLVNSIKQYIVSETKVSKTKADKIYNYLYNEYYDYGLRECLYHLDELLELFND